MTPDKTPLFDELYKANFDRVLIGDIDVYACRTCGALVWYDDQGLHLNWHKEKK